MPAREAKNSMIMLLTSGSRQNIFVFDCRSLLRSLTLKRIRYEKGITSLYPAHRFAPFPNGTFPGARMWFS
jgi:hypothetical protein